MASQAGYATFTIAAKDAASGVMGKIGNSMGKLKSIAGTAFKTLAAGALAAAAAIGALAVTAIKSAIEDEASTSRLNAALKARGLAVKALTPAINAQIAAGQKLGFTDDETRASLEAATRFTKDFTKAQQISKVAQDVARATGVDLATATVNVGKAYAGAGGRLLKTLGITDKGIKGQAALDAIFGKVQGSADAYAQTVGGKFGIAQDRMNEQIEALGYRLLPAVSGAMDFIATSVLPITDAAFQAIGDAITSVGDEISKPGGMLESVGAVAGEFLNSMKPGVEAVASALGPFIQAVLNLAGALWGDGKGPLAVAVTFIGEALNNLMLIIKPVLDILTAIINAINGVITGAAKLGDNPANNQGFQFSGGAAPSAGGGFTYGGTGTGGGITIKNNISFGKDAVSFVDTSLGRTVSRGSTRTAP
jgi:hypothetical protein